jgi:hypothetical protein
MASICFSLNNFFFSVNLFRFVYIENYQRRSLAPVRYTAIGGERKQMKKIIFLILAVEILFLQSGNAQLIKSYGFKVAYTSADQKFNYTNLTNIETKRRVGFNVAIYAEWLNTPFISLVTQCEYAQRGMGMEFNRTANSPDIIGTFIDYNRVDYLSIPIFVKLSLPVEPINPYLLLGPRIDFLLGYKSDESAFNAVYDGFSKTMTGASFAVGVDLNTLLPLAILIEARYNVDFKDSYSTQYLTVRNNSFDLWLGLNF